MLKAITVIFITIFISFCLWINFDAANKIKPKELGGKPTVENTIKNTILNLENSYISPISDYKKYQFIPKATDASSGYTYWVDEYVVWDGKDIPRSTGYQLYIIRPDGYQMSTGTDPSQSYNWKLIPTTTPYLEYLKTMQ